MGLALLLGHRPIVTLKAIEISVTIGLGGHVCVSRPCAGLAATSHVCVCLSVGIFVRGRRSLLILVGIAPPRLPPRLPLVRPAGGDGGETQRPKATNLA